ncbi:MAG: hypothetical protein QM642_08610 [Edaphocola sp.]
MKKKRNLCLAFLGLLMCFSASVYGQQDGHLRGTWTEWKTVYEEPAYPTSYKIEIAFNLTKCDKNGNCIGYSFYRIRSNFKRPKAMCRFSFEYVRCGGKIDNDVVYYSMEKPEVTNGLGQHFSGIEIRAINLLSVVDYGKKQAEALKPTLDATKQGFDASYTTYTGKLNNVKNAQTKAQYQTKLSNAKTNFNKNYQLAQQYYQQGNDEKMREHLNLAKSEKKKLDEQLNLLNDVVERQVVGTTQQQTANTNTITTNKTATTNTTATTNNMATGNKPVTISQPKTVDNSAAMAQLQQTQNYIDEQNRKREQTTQTVTNAIQDFGTALQSYQASRQREKENRENRRLQQNENAANYLSCELSKYYNRYFLSEYPYLWNDCYSEFDPNSKYSSSSEQAQIIKGDIDSINYYYKKKDYLGGVHLLYDKFRTNIKDNFLNVGSATFALSSLYVYTRYTRTDNYSETKKELEKQLAKGKYNQTRQLLKVGITSLLEEKNTEYASFCFNELLKQNSPAYFKKSACLFLGLIKTKQGIESNSNDLLNEAIFLLDKAYNITQSVFLSIGDSYSNVEYSDYYFGLFVYPEYNQLLQFAIMQEIAHGFYYKYKLTNNPLYLQSAYDYYYNFPTSVTKK